MTALKSKHVLITPEKIAMVKFFKEHEVSNKVIRDVAKVSYGSIYNIVRANYDFATYQKQQHDWWVNYRNKRAGRSQQVSENVETSAKGEFTKRKATYSDVLEAFKSIEEKIDLLLGRKPEEKEVQINKGTGFFP